MIDQPTPKRPRIDEEAYRGEWLALHPETFVVVAHAVSLRQAKDEAAEKGVAQPLLHSVPESDGYFIRAG